MNAKLSPSLISPFSVWEILEATTDCVCLLDKDWVFTFLNRHAVETIARGADLIGRNIWDIFTDSVGTPFQANYERAVRDRVPVSFDEYSPDLHILFEVHAYPTSDGLALFFRDITAQRAKETGLQKIEERYHLATQSTTEGIWDWDHVTNAAYFSNRWQEIVGLPPVEFIGTMDHWRRRFHPRDIPRMEQDYQQIIQDNSSEFQHEYRVCHEDRSWHWLLSRGTVVRDVSGTIVRMTGSISDITEKKSIDPLTGLLNRISLLENLEQRLDKPLAKRRPFAVLMICLNRFRQVTDSLGQTSSDAALIEIALRLQSTLEGDERSVASRISTHEFVILLEQISEIDDVLTYANHLKLLLEAPIEFDGHQMSITISIGIAMGDEGYTLPEKMLEDAMVAMQQADKARATKCIVFGVEMRKQTRRRVQIEMDIENAVEARQLILHYQPKVELLTGGIIGFEALVRWVHPTLGLIAPQEFIPCAEESGAILGLGHWSIREAVHQLMSWQTGNLIDPGVTMSVNLSTKQLEDPALVELIQTTLAIEHAPPQCLTLELTESALIGNIDHAKEILGRLRRLGITLDLDDFGTGYSSLSYLHRLPFHAIKIDRSFIRDLEASQESRAIAQSIIRLGESLNMDVIAEGIETAAQRDRLIQLGCLYGQGYFYSIPLGTKVMQQALHASKLARTA